MIENDSLNINQWYHTHGTRIGEEAAFADLDVSSIPQMLNQISEFEDQDDNPFFEET